MNPMQIKGRLLDFAVGACHCCRPVAIGIENGFFSAIDELPAVAPASPLLMTPFANGHDHLRGVKPISLGAFDLPLELWLTSMSNIPPVDPYLVASAALGRQALGGVGSIMIHYTRPRDNDHVSEELETVARAAEAVGVRVAIAVAMRDRNPLGYGPDETILQNLSPADQTLIRAKLMQQPRRPDEQLLLVEELAARIESPLVTVQYGPYGIEWCSKSLLERIAVRSAETGRRVHMHLLESQVQREYLDHAYRDGPIRYLDEIGLLSDRLSVAHGVWLRPDEMELLAECGVTVSTNASSNLSIRSGIPPVAEMHRRGVSLAMGLDGFSFDDDDDAFRELRLNYLLHKGAGLKDGLPLQALLEAACYGGRRCVTGIEKNNGIEMGAPADLMVLDYDAIAKDVVVAADEARVLVHRGTSRILKQLTVAGRDIVRDGRLTGLDLASATAELDAQVRHGAASFRSWREVSGRLADALRGFYEAGMHRCG